MTILSYPAPVLRQPCAPLDLTDGAVRSHLRVLVGQLAQWMHAAKGWGLAAPQVGVAVRVFVVYVPHEMSAPIAFVNPVIEETSARLCNLREGCLSFKGIYDTIARPESVTVARHDQNGRFDRHEFTGWTARAILHEADHLEGKLMIDHMLPAAAKKVDKIMRKKWKKAQ